VPALLRKWAEPPSRQHPRGNPRDASLRDGEAVPAAGQGRRTGLPARGAGRTGRRDARVHLRAPLPALTANCEKERSASAMTWSRCTCIPTSPIAGGLTAAAWRGCRRNRGRHDVAAAARHPVRARPRRACAGHLPGRDVPPSEGIPVNNHFDITRPSSARIYDYLLGGKDNFESDRRAAQELLAAVPRIQEWARENRLFLANAIHYLANLGIGQFIDIGAGLPAAQNTHEIALSVNPDAVVAYVDYDVQVISHARALLAEDSPQVHAIDGDLREPIAVMHVLSDCIDLSRPVAVLLVAVLHFIPGEVAYDIVNELMSIVAPGSYLVLSHGTSDHVTPEKEKAVLEVYERAAQQAAPRSLDEITRFFDGLEVTDHGITGVGDWGSPTAREIALGYAGVARKPEKSSHEPAEVELQLRLRELRRGSGRGWVRAGA
jgi:S-adenosyl methyltransferase